MDGFTLREKIGQLMVFGFDGTTATEEIKALIRENKVGGIILFGRNIGSPYGVLALTRELQTEARDSGHEFPLLICIDQENGLVRRLGEGTTIFPNPYDLGYFPDIPCYLATYEYTLPALQVASRVLFGIEEAAGPLPVTIL